MFIGPSKETIAYVFKQRVAVGGLYVVKDPTLKAQARNKWDSPSLLKYVNQAMKVMAGSQNPDLRGKHDESTIRSEQVERAGTYP